MFPNELALQFIDRKETQHGRGESSQGRIHDKRGEAVSTIKKLVREGNIRRITIKNKEGKTLIEIPLTFGVVGALFLPTLAAIGAIAALVTECTIVVEKVEKDEPSQE